MLTSLRRRAEPVREPDAIDMLLECHERIRRFTRMAVWLTSASDAPPEGVKETAAAILRYFTEALPLHSADEDQSLVPRLLAQELPGDLRVLVLLISPQHAAIDETLGLLAPRWRAAASDPGTLVEGAAEMERLVRRLRSQWDVHLHLEEAAVFPAARARLPASVLAEVAREMRARRS